ncbi:MAG: hypothetical protein WC401_10160 [Bacteroidales bacterium]
MLCRPSGQINKLVNIKVMITTPQHDDLPEITWELGDVIDTDPEERMKVYEASGYDKEGCSYVASAYFFAGVFEQMEGIEKL